MRNLTVFFIVMLFFCCSFVPCAGAQEIEFSKPKNKEARDYLGLEGDSKTFRLYEVKADVVIVEVFSWNCHFCERQAPRIVQLYDMLASKGYSGRIKIIGIGATNSDSEVREYQNRFNIPFPLISDPDYKSYSFVGEKDIPCISVFKRFGPKILRLVYSRSREQRSAEAMLKDILSATGL